MKILLVEDNKALASAIGMRLKSYGYQTIQAPDAISAVSAAIAHQPDLAIVDINLPGGNGFTVMDRIADSSDCPDMPVIVVTASNDTGLREQARQHGAAAFLEKPFGAESLLNAIDSAAA
jgi:CheY-like chemotaxis protein